jgi:hypothetical protein
MVPCHHGEYQKHRVHIEWHLPFSGLHSIVMVKLAQAGEDRGAVVVYAPAERADTLPLFLLYPYMYSVRRNNILCKLFGTMNIVASSK